MIKTIYATCIPVHYSGSVLMGNSGKWAVCSGSIDATDSSPESAAQREISEETGLSVPVDIQLLRRGKPFALVDEALKTEWTIHPFAWELKPSAKAIKLDWEHTEVRFVNPASLIEHDHVPLLEIGMDRVLVSKEIVAGIQELKDDHESGAQALAVRALEILLSSVKNGDLSKLSSTTDFWAKLRMMAWHLAKNGRPSMAAAIETQLFKALDAAKRQIHPTPELEKSELPISSVLKIAEDAITSRIEARSRTLERLSHVFIGLIETKLPDEGGLDEAQPLRIVTLSSSGTISRCLSLLISQLTSKNRKISLTVLESRPNFEGVSFVNSLISSLKVNSRITDNLGIEIVSDSSMAEATKNADYLILGGDKVSLAGDVSNKIGSLSAAIVAKTVNPKCHVIAAFDTGKITSSSLEEQVEYNDEWEVTEAWPRGLYDKIRSHREANIGIEVHNAYFEWVAAKWIDAYVSEEGVLDVSDIERLGKQSKELEDSLFSDL